MGVCADDVCARACTCGCARVYVNVCAHLCLCVSE